MNTISGNLLLKNSAYNFAGSIAPLFVALFTIPFLVKGLGEEKFGVLSLAWVVIGYFSLFDFGIGRTLTKIVAEKIGLEEIDEIPGLFWTALFLMFIISLIGSIILLIGSPYLVINIFNISKEYQEQSIYTFYTLALSIPIVTTTAGLRGVLEAYQKFGMINLLRSILGVFTFVGPLICLIFTNDLFVIVLVLSLFRLIIWIFFYIECKKLNAIHNAEIKIVRNLIKPILKTSTWMSISNLIGPIILYVDRFLIGALISAVAVTFYTTPYEVVTKLLIIPSALASVLFPAIASNYKTNPEYAGKLFAKSVKYIFIILFPIVLIISIFAQEGLNIWLGGNFANSSTLVLQLFAVGIFLNSLAFSPFTYLQSIGRPDITAKIHLFELPLYLILMWYFIPKFGITGAALVWLIRIFIDTALLFIFTQKFFHKKAESNFGYTSNLVLVLLSIIIVMSTIFISGIVYKLLFVVIVLLTFSIVVWKKILEPEDLSFIFSKIKSS
jgi:O-antigen/teichoic acid export membrane protein